MKKLIVIISVMVTYYVCDNFIFEPEPWPPEEKTKYDSFESAEVYTTFVPQTTGAYHTIGYMEFKIYTWDKFENNYSSINNVRTHLNKYNDYKYYKNLEKKSGVIVRELIFYYDDERISKGLKKWSSPPATWYGYWNLNSNSNIEVKWVAVSGDEMAGSNNWFQQNYGHLANCYYPPCKSGWVDISEKTIFKPILLDGDQKGYSDSNTNYIINTVSISWYSIFCAILIGSLISRIQKMQEARRAEEQRKQEAKERQKIEKQAAKERQKIEKQAAKERRERKTHLISIYGENDGNKIFNGEIWLDMTKEMLIESWGHSKDEKEDVSKNKIKLKWYYGSRTTRQGTIVYKYEVRLENDIVVGWKELE